jgi:hypothetical protein
MCITEALGPRIPQLAKKIILKHTFRGRNKYFVSIFTFLKDFILLHILVAREATQYFDIYGRSPVVCSICSVAMLGGNVIVPCFLASQLATANTVTSATRITAK